MQRNNELVKKWEPGIQSMLVGCKIIGASYTTQAEMDDMGWVVAGLVIELDTGTFLTVCQDDEGNGPGALHTTIKGLEIIPVI